MNQRQLEIALRIARAVRERQIRAADGRRNLRDEAGIAEGSAKIIIEVYQDMCEGRIFKRHLSRVDMSFFLSSFATKGEPAELAKALDALRLHIRWRESKGVSQRSNRLLLAEHEARLLEKTDSLPVSIGAIETELAQAVKRSLEGDRIARQQRLSRAIRQPRRVIRQVYVYERNPDVVAEVLDRARGVCERCARPAPFQRRVDDTPYLEVHHIVMLSQGGEDTVANAEALCPNCHRERHHGSQHEVVSLHE